MGEGSWRCRVAACGRLWRGVHTFPGPNWDGGEGWEEVVHTPSCVAYVTKAREHFMLVKWTLNILAVSLIRGRGKWGSGGEGGRGGYR